MRHISHSLRYILPTAIGALLLFCLGAPSSAFAQHHGPKYDVSTETTFEATVEDIAVPQGPHELVRVTFVVNGAKAEALLAPEKFLKMIDLQLKKGEKLKVTASKVKDGDAELLLVRIVTRDKDDYIMRAPDGSPAW